MTAGDALRDEMASALAHAVREAGRPLQFDERENLTIESAAAAADRAEALAALWTAELASGEVRASVAVKIAAELRLCEKHVADLLARVNPGPGQAKSDRHVRAARSRWDREPGGIRRGPA
jgi:acyl-CoA reductase-like NAD-dependent aldehyde dehydrogenase